MSTPTRAPLAPLFLTVFIDLLGFGLTIPLLPYYARHHGATPLMVALLASAYSAMQFLFMPLWGALSDRVGRRPVLLTSIAATAVSMALLGFARSYPELLAVRLFQGLATANIAVAQAYIADASPPEERARSMGLIGAAFGLGFILGPFAGGVLAHRSHALPGLVASALSVVNFALAWTRLPESLRRVEGPKVPLAAQLRDVLVDNLTLRALRRVVRVPGVVALSTLFFFHVLSFTNVESTSAMFWCDRFALTERETGYTFAFIGVVVAVMQGGLLGGLVRRFGERTLLRVGLAMLAVSMVGITVIHASPDVDLSRCDRAMGFGVFVARMGAAWPVILLMAAGNALVMPNVSSLTSKLAPAGSTGAVLGAQQSASSLARVFGPAIAGGLYGAFGPAAPYYASAAGMLIALALALTQIDERAPKPRVL